SAMPIRIPTRIANTLASAVNRMARNHSRMRRQFANASRVLGSCLGVKSLGAIAASIVSVFEAKKRFRLRALVGAANYNPRENYGIRLLLPDFLAFCLVHSAQAIFNSTP
ncbi:MAG TPA: hypothetical protein VNT76_12545, partial [Candidatus Binatus sp.]|nr:hypothetical protein [Candidatus Binatus sp.]